MLRKLLSILVGISLAVSVVEAQGLTLTIGTAPAPTVGQAVSVPITVQGFSNVGSISLSISYNSTILTFTGLANGLSGTLGNASGGRINISWFSTSGATIADGGKLLDLQFTYNGGLSGSQATPLTFVTSGCEMANLSGIVIMSTFKNGSVLLGTTDVLPGGGGIASEFKVYQNYPNPFNPTTFIQYIVPKAEQVVLRIFDISGSLVMEPVNRTHTAGTYVVRIEARSLASGVYFYQLNAGEWSSVRRMILEK